MYDSDNAGVSLMVRRTVTFQLIFSHIIPTLHIYSKFSQINKQTSLKIVSKYCGCFRFNLNISTDKFIQDYQTRLFRLAYMS